MITRSLRVLGVAGVVCAAGLSACGSSSSSHAAAPTSVPATTATTAARNSGGSAGNLAAQADAVCAEIKSASSALGNLNLSAPQSAKTAISTVSNDLSQLQGSLQKVSNSGQSGAQSGPLQAMVNDVHGAMHQINGALSDLVQGNLGSARTGYQQAVNDLKLARQEGQSANIKSCS